MIRYDMIYKSQIQLCGDVYTKHALGVGEAYHGESSSSSSSGFSPMDYIEWMHCCCVYCSKPGTTTV